MAEDCHLRNRMEKERAVETDREIDLKLGMGGLADIEFMVQGQLLVGGRRTEDGKGSERVPRSVRRLVREFLQETSRAGSSGISSTEMSTAFDALRALDHRVRLHTNSSTAKLDERRFEAMLLLGLWPPRFDGASIETWEDILRLRREVRGAFKRFCPQCS